MHLIHLPYKKEIHALKHKLADFLVIDKSKIKFHKHTATISSSTIPVYPSVDKNIGYFTIKPFKKHKYQLIYEFLFKTQVHSVPIAPLPRQKYIIPLYSILENGSLPSIQYNIQLRSELFFNIVDFCYKQNKTIFDLLHKLKMRNIIYYPSLSNIPALLQITTDMSGIPTLTASAKINNNSENIVIYTQNISRKNNDYPKLANDLSKKIKKIIENFSVTLSKNDDTYNNIRITVYSSTDVNHIKKLLKNKKYTVSNTHSDQYVIKMNVKYLEYSSNDDSCSNSSSDSYSSSESHCSSESSLEYSNSSSSKHKSYPSTWSSSSKKSSSSTHKKH